MNIIVIGTQRYNWALQPMNYLLEKYWGIEAIHWGDKDSGFMPFKRVPAYADGEWPWDHWFGNGLLSILDALSSEVFCLLLPDHWISQPVESKGITGMARVTIINKKRFKTIPVQFSRHAVISQPSCILTFGFIRIMAGTIPQMMISTTNSQ